MKRIGLVLVALLALAQVASAQSLVDGLQEISVTVKSDGGGYTGQGSGVIVTRKVGEKTLAFIWTAAHVVDNLRSERPYTDPATGQKKTAVEFSDAAIVQEFRQAGRRIGEVKMDARVLKYSDAETGEDLALLQVRKYDFVSDKIGAKFYLDKEIPAIGTELFHVGSLLGQVGSNSLTTGVISQHGRVLNFGANSVVFDQTTATAFPGSSGGGVFLKSDGRYVGMLVRGAGEGFNLIVPVRRLHDWSKKAGVEWAVDPNVKVPDEETLAKITVEDTGPSGAGQSADAKLHKTHDIKLPDYSHRHPLDTP